MIPDQGTMPMRRRMLRRTHAEEVDDEALDEAEEDEPSMAFRVISIARGRRRTRKGASGAARRLAKMEPTVVSAVRRSVANMGEKSAPARTFCVVEEKFC